jgi:RNA polymerase sigma factor (sigma-70 family)
MSAAGLLAFLRRRCPPSTSDAELLRAYADRHDTEAFSVLLERHGPVVLRLCQRRLRDAHAAEDAFQATFLILARSARSVRRPEALVSWLYGVALRVTRKAQSLRARRQYLEAHAETGHPQDPAAEVTAGELFDALDEELHRLPDRYRLPLWLCYWQGLTQDEAARRLGWSPGSVKGRLERGRKQLADRLTRRGFAPPALLAAPLAAVAAVPGDLLARTAAFATAPWSNSLPSAVLALAGVSVSSHLAPASTVVALVTGIGLIGLVASREGERTDEAPTPVANTHRSPDQPPDAEARPRLDRHGDPLPAGAIARFGTIRLRHAGTVNCVAFAPGGNLLASGGDDEAIRCWDTRTGELVRTFRGLDGGARGLAFTPDGKTLIAGAAKGGVLLWAMDAERPPMSLADGVNGVTALALSTDGMILAVGSADGAVRVWDWKARRELPRWPVRHKVAVNVVAVSPDGRHVASSSGRLTDDGNRIVESNEIWLWTTDASREPVALRAGKMWGYGCVAFSMDGKTLIAGGWVLHLTAPNTFSPRGMIDIWDTATATRRKHLEAPPQQWDVVGLAPAGDRRTLLARYADGVVGRWDLATGDPLPDLGGDRVKWHSHRRPALASSSDGRFFAAGGYDGAVTMWDAATSKPHLAFEQDARGWTTSLAYSADGRTLASGGYDGTVRVWDASTGLLRSRIDLPAPILQMGLASDGRSVATVLQVIRPQESWVSVLNATTGRESHRFPNGMGGASPLAFAPDGRTLAYRRLEGADVSGVYKDFLDLRDVKTGALLASLQAPPYFTRQIAYTADGGRFMAGAREVAVWDLNPVKPRYRFPLNHPSDAVCFSPDGRIVAVVPDQTVPNADRKSEKRLLSMWEVTTGKPIWEEALPDGRDVCMAFSVDSRRLVVAPTIARHDQALPRGEKAIQVYDAASGRVVRSISLPKEEAVTAMAFTADGRTLSTGLLDSSVVVWDWPPAAVPANRMTPEHLAKHWEALRSSDPRIAYPAIVALTAAPADATELLARELRPARALERDELRRLVADLDSDRFAVRDAAAKRLEQLGDENESAVKRALDNGPSNELRRRLEAWLADLTHIGLVGARLRSLRGAQVLERIGTIEARRVLADLAKGDPAARLTKEAKAGLDRLK